MVEQHLRRLNVRKSPGADEITPPILRYCRRQLCQSLCELFNHSLSEEVVPCAWKTGVISPIYEGGSRSDTTNYRPVTLIPTISKVMERIVAERIMSHLEPESSVSSLTWVPKNRSPIIA